MEGNGYTAASGMSSFSLDTIKRMCTVRDAYSAGIISRAKAAQWGFRLTVHMAYNASDPQDRVAFQFITSGGRFA
jgi:hypothetical protein